MVFSYRRKERKKDRKKERQKERKNKEERKPKIGNSQKAIKTG